MSNKAFLSVEIQLGENNLAKYPSGFKIVENFTSVFLHSNSRGKFDKKTLALRARDF